MIFILTSLLSAATAFSGRLDVGEPGPMHRPCDAGALSRCLQQEQNSEQACRSQVNTFQQQLTVVQNDLSARQEQASAVSSALNGIEAQLRSARAEMSFLDDLAKKPPASTEFFPGSPSLERLFLLDRLSTEWDERYLAERRQKLKAQESLLANSSQKFAFQRNEIESEINSLTLLQNNLDAQKNQWINEVNLHARMWQSGCRQQVCPSN